MKTRKNMLLPGLRKYGLFIILFLAGAGVLAVDKVSQVLSVRLYGFNYMQQSIYYYTVNGTMGGDVTWGEPEGGGKITCCADIKGNTVLVKWAMSGTLEEVKAKVPPKTYEKKLTLPPYPLEKPKFLEVHFLSLQDIKLRWSDWPRESLQPIREFEEVEKERAQQNLLQEQKK